MPKILCLALNPAIDISSDAEVVRHTHKTRTHNQQQFPGGGGINVARVIVTLGGTCELMFLSGGATGELLEAMLKPLPIVERAFKIHDPVRVAFAVHETSTNLEYRFVPEGPLVSDAELAPVFEAIETSDADYVVASGSLPRGAPDDTYVRLADIAAKTGARFVLDTSGAPLAEALSKSKMFLVKPSLGEFEAFLGRKLSHSEVGAAAQAYARSGAAQYIAVTLGGDGAVGGGVGAGVFRGTACFNRHITNASPEEGGTNGLDVVFAGGGVCARFAYRVFKGGIELTVVNMGVAVADSRPKSNGYCRRAKIGQRQRRTAMATIVAAHVALVEFVHHQERQRPGKGISGPAEMTE